MRLPLIIIITGHFMSTSLQAQYLNVVIGTSFDPNEPSICISPANTNLMVAGSNLDNYYYSQDGGNTWNGWVLGSSYGVWGDPVLVADTAGNFYYFHLSNPPQGSWIDRIVCQKSINGGSTWNNGSFTGLNGIKAQDKEWATVNPANNHIYVTWTQFDNYGSSNPSDSTHIFFSRSDDGAITWTTPKRLDQHGGDCLDEDNTVEGAVPASGPNGEIYVAWAGPLGLVFTKSLDEGNTWPASNQVICGIPGGWDFSIPGISRCNGLPFTSCDLSDGPYRGNIYINWSDQRNGTDDTDIWFVSSTDGGNTWSNPLRVNNDAPGKQQFFSSMTVDQATGYIYVVFYDRRYRSGSMTDVYMAVSKDGGQSFTNFIISESPFTPSSAVFFGDYTHIAAHNNVVRPIWARLNGASLSIMTALVDSISTSIPPEKKQEVPLSLEQNYPNPAHGETFLSYKLHATSSVSLYISDIYGKILFTLKDHETMPPGKYIERFDPTRNGLQPGFYLISLVNGEQSISRKMVVE